MAYDLNYYDNILENSQLSKIGDVYFTVIEEETYNYSNTITDKPVEDGSIVTDHVKSNLITVNLTGLIFGKDEYPQEKLTILRTYALEGIILKYVGIQSFSSVVIENFDNKHTKEVANGIEFNITLKEIRITNKTEINVNTKSLAIPDIEQLKADLQAQKSQKKADAKARIKGVTSGGRQGKKVTKVRGTDSTKTRTPKTKKSVLEKIMDRY